MQKTKRIFMKPGKTNKEDRENFINFWVEFMKSVSDREWSKQQVEFINSQLEMTRNFYKSLEKTDEGKKTLRRLIEMKNR